MSTPASDGAALARIIGLAGYSMRAPVALIATAAGQQPLCLTPSGSDNGWRDAWGTTNASAICQYIIASGEPVLIGDLRKEGFAHSGTTNGAGEYGASAIAYAGVPLHSPTGVPLGALCVIDRKPRNWDQADLSVLLEMAVAIEAFPQFSSDKRVEAQVRQSLKLDAVGRLAGGIAHDFNNILTAIRGHADLLIEDVSSADPRRPDIEEIRRSTERAALLTHQLLAFSRKQILQPSVLDLTSLLPVWASRLRKEFGDSITIEIDVDSVIGPIKADPNRLEAVIANLIANARDAMPGGGTARITASNLVLDERFASRFPYRVQPGPYTRIAVADHGQGMDEATLEQIFEPFFTTRGPSSGAGLGLSTVYGVVKQSGGYIWAKSELGQGTTIEVFLPRLQDTEVLPATFPVAVKPPPETILLVEDEEVVRSLARRILEKDGYRIIEARDGEEAMQIAQSRLGEIDLLLTDLTMPGMNGRELADRLTVLRPGIRILFISGYTEDDDFRRSVNRLGAFLPKPFTPDILGKKVREVLAQTAGGSRSISLEG